ncbi:MAG TPA: GNAT family protein [Bacteroidales bacterium]|nr:GNAT family protein [Bacteroidales bacterium]
MQNNRVNLRAVEPADIDFIYRLENDAHNMISAEQKEPVSRYAIEQYVLSVGDGFFTSGQMKLIIESNDTPEKKSIGCVDLFEGDTINRRAGIGIFIVAEAQKKGYASAALGLMIEYCFETLGLHQLFCNIGEENKDSLKLFTNHGFQIVGLKKDWRYYNKSWKNEYMLQLING